MQPIQMLCKITQHPYTCNNRNLAKVNETLTPTTGSAAQVGFDPANVELDGFNRLARSSVNRELNCIIVNALCPTGALIKTNKIY